MNSDYNAMKILSYIFLYVNLTLQVIFSPAQLGRYAWVANRNGATEAERNAVLTAVFDQ